MRYSAILVEHFRNPRNVGLMREPDGSGTAEEPGCLDRVRVFLRVEGDRIREVRYQAHGCGPTIAAASAASEVIAGHAVAAAAELEPERVEAALGGLPEDRRHAAAVVAEAIRAAARDALVRRGGVAPAAPGPAGASHAQGRPTGPRGVTGAGA